MSRDSEISLLIFDENVAVCDLLARRFQGMPGFRVVAHTAIKDEAVSMARDLSPQLILADFKASSACPDALRLIAKLSANACLVVHKANYKDGEYEAFRKAGAALCLLKGMRIDDLVTALQNAVRQHLVTE